MSVKEEKFFKVWKRAFWGVVHGSGSRFGQTAGSHSSGLPTVSDQVDFPDGTHGS